MKCVIDLYLGDCLHQLKNLDDNSIDSVVTDPPYGLSFMGKKWDYDVPSVEIWREVLRVLKPGGHLLSFGGTRTYHRMVVNIEDAVFEIRDQIMWIYGSGFPKSQDVSKAIDKMAGAKRKVVGQNPNHRTLKPVHTMVGAPHSGDGSTTAPATPEAKQWYGWGTALKPANEPIVLARKPLEKGLTVAANVLKWGTGGINVDGCRIGTGTLKPVRIATSALPSNGKYGEGLNGSLAIGDSTQGRWPANIIFDEAAAKMLDEQSGVSKSAIRPPSAIAPTGNGKTHGAMKALPTVSGVADFGGASRFFYVAKASKSERNKGLEGMPIVKCTAKQQNSKCQMENGNLTNERPDEPAQQNFHPTVKPIKLMEYLCRLVTPPNGIILDPFMGSGSTGVAAKNLGFNFIGCEMNEEYLEIAKRRICG